MAREYMIQTCIETPRTAVIRKTVFPSLLSLWHQMVLSTYKHRTGLKLNEDNSHLEAELLGIGLHSEFPSKTLSPEKDI